MVTDTPHGDEVARRIARYERLSAILWIGLGILQVLAVVTAIAGAWNIYAASSRFLMAKAIEEREPWVPAAFEPISGLITIGFINLVLGGIVGAFFVLLDLWIRKQVLENAGVFDAQFELASDAPARELPRTYGQRLAANADDPATEAETP